MKPDLQSHHVPASTNVLGVRVHGVDEAGLLALARAWSRARTRRTILYVNAHCLNAAYLDPDYRELLNRADLVYADGIGPVVAGRFLGSNHLQKTTGSDWIRGFCRMAGPEGLRLYLLAGRAGVVEAARERMLAEYLGLQIVGVSDGYFQTKREAEVLEDIDRTRPDVLFVGMGTPRQEAWIARHRQAISAPLCWAVGSLFDLFGGVEAWPPGWAGALGLQWFWRWMMDPVGKFRRYMLGNPLFLSRVLRQRLDPRRFSVPEPMESLSER